MKIWKSAVIGGLLLDLIYPSYTVAISGWEVTNITDTGSSDQKPVLVDSKVYYAKNLDVWVYDLATKQHSPLIVSPKYEAPIGLIDGRLLYLKYEGSPDEYDIWAFNLSTLEDEVLIGGPGTQIPGTRFDAATDGTWIIYLEGYGTGDLYAYNYFTQEKKLLANSVSEPRIHNGKVVWIFSNSGLSGIAGHNLNTNQPIPLPSNVGILRQLADVSSKYVVWSQRNPDLTFDIWTYELPTGEITQITNTPEEDTWPSVDGSLVAWATIDSATVGSINGQDLEKDTQSTQIFSDTKPSNYTTLTSTQGGRVFWDWHTKTGDIFMAERVDINDLLHQIINLAKHGKKDKLLKGYEAANITRPATHALRDLQIYEQRLKQGREEAAQDSYESYLENLDKIDEALDKIAERPGREEFVAKIRALLDEIRNPSPSPSPTPTPSPSPTPTDNCSSFVNDSQPVVVDDFNGYSDGSVVGQGSWQSYVNGSNFAIQEAVVNEGAKAVRNNSFGDSGVGKQGTMRADGKQAVCFRTEDRDNWGFYGADGNVGFRVSQGFNGTTFASVSLKKDGHVAYYDPVADVYSDFATYDDNEWTLLEIEWRSSDKTARYRVNGGAWTDWKTFREIASFTGFDYANLAFVLPSGSGGVYFDSLK